MVQLETRTTTPRPRYVRHQGSFGSDSGLWISSESYLYFFSSWSLQLVYSRRGVYVVWFPSRFVQKRLARFRNRLNSIVVCCVLLIDKKCLRFIEILLVRVFHNVSHYWTSCSGATGVCTAFQSGIDVLEEKERYPTCYNCCRLGVMCMHHASGAASVGNRWRGGWRACRRANRMA